MPIATTAAIVGGAALLGAGASVVAANKNKSAIANSTDANLTAQRESIASQERISQQQIAAQQQALTQGLAYQTNALNANLGQQASSFNSSGQLQTDLYNQRVGILQPWAAGGGQAFNAINSMLGLGTQKFSTPSAVKFSPVAASSIAPPPVASTATPGAPATGAPATATPAANAMLATPTPNAAQALQSFMSTPEYRAMTASQQGAARVAYLKGGTL